MTKTEIAELATFRRSQLALKDAIENVVEMTANAERLLDMCRRASRTTAR